MSDRKPKTGLAVNAPKVKPMKMGPVNTESVASEPSTNPKGGDRKTKLLPKE
jgi:hypothetical protein